MSDGSFPPLRIAYLGWGDHVHLERWAGYFAREQQDVRILTLSNYGRYPASVRQYRVGLAGRDERLRHLRLRWLLLRARPDVLHVHWAHFAYSAVHAWQGPLVVTCWGSDIYKLKDLNPGTLERLQHALPRAQAITCDSLDLAREIERLVPEVVGRVHVIQWGVDTDHFSPSASPEEYRRKLNVGAGPVVFSPRNFMPIYNQEIVVEAFRYVLDARPDAVLVFKDYGGDPCYRARVMERAAELDVQHAVRVVELVPYEEMPGLYTLASVAVSVPSSDGTPMSLLEAMACGAVPVVSDLPSLREWVDDGVNGHLVPVGDAKALGHAMLNALAQHARGEWAIANRRRVEERASQRVHMENMLQIYRRLARPRAARGNAGPSAVPYVARADE